MNIIKQAAQLAAHVPGGTKILSAVPFSWRYGGNYKRIQREGESFETLEPERKKDWIFERMKRLVAHAGTNVPFYTNFYREAGFSTDELRDYGDIQRIPIVTKADFLRFPLQERIQPCIRASVSNTGGTSGQTLSFMVEPHLRDKEWAYMHRIWKRREYGAGCLKLRFRGANLGEDLLRYNPGEGEFLVNTYLDHARTCAAIEMLIRRHPIRYLHGYPSAIYGFACYCRDHLPERLMKPLQKSLRGILLGSEFPSPAYRDVIDDVFGPISLSWYGHSEMAVLAGENGHPYVYEPFQSYGHVEAVTSRQGDSKRLVATNYDGFASPFIRYDTGDLIEPVDTEEGLLRSFRIAEGRVGDFVLDAKGHQVSLTALIFGRHHQIFNTLKYVQVAQRKPGEVLIIATVTDDSSRPAENFWQDFDSSGVDISFDVKFVPSPYRSPAGKVPLKVPFPEG